MTFLMVTFVWVLFRAETLQGAGRVYSALFVPTTTIFELAEWTKVRDAGFLLPIVLLAVWVLPNSQEVMGRYGPALRDYYRPITTASNGVWWQWRPSIWHAAVTAGMFITSFCAFSREMEHVLEKQFAECARRGVILHVVIPPSHASYWEYLELIGWGERVVAGKCNLVRLVSSANSQYDGTSCVKLWDFSGFRGPAAEPSPTEDAPIVMHWHKDSVYFKRSLGNLVIDKPTGRGSSYPDLAIELTQDNLERHLEETRTAMTMYRGNCPPPQKVAIGPHSAMH